MRSLLMVPAHRERCLEKAEGLPADALVYDLEDSVPGDKKHIALVTLLSFLRVHRETSRKRFVRINPGRIKQELGALDGYVTGFMVPKVRRVRDLQTWKYPTLMVIETPQAVMHLEELMYQPFVIGAVFGVGDYSAEMGVIDRPWVSSVNSRFAYAKQKLATVARAYGKHALDTSFYVKGILAQEDTRRQWIESASWGFTGASPIHPSHVDIANDVFMASSKEIQWSRQVISGVGEHADEVYVDKEGFAVGPPHLRQAKGKLYGNDGRGNEGNHD